MPKERRNGVTMHPPIHYLTVVRRLPQRYDVSRRCADRAGLCELTCRKSRTNVETWEKPFAIRARDVSLPAARKPHLHRDA